MVLSDREVKVLAGVGQGLEIKEVAHRLQLSKRTVMYCLSDLRKRVESQVGSQVPTTTSLTARSAELGIFPLGWRLGPNGRLVRSVQAATRESLGMNLQTYTVDASVAIAPRVKRQDRAS